MPLGSLGSTSVVPEETLEAGLGESPTMVEVEEERLKVLARGARWVSLSSSSMLARGTRKHQGQWHTLCELPRHDGRRVEDVKVKLRSKCRSGGQGEG